MTDEGTTTEAWRPIAGFEGPVGRDRVEIEGALAHAVAPQGRHPAPRPSEGRCGMSTRSAFVTLALLAALMVALSVTLAFVAGAS